MRQVRLERWGLIQDLILEQKHAIIKKNRDLMAILMDELIDFNTDLQIGCHVMDTILALILLYGQKYPALTKDDYIFMGFEGHIGNSRLRLISDTHAQLNGSPVKFEYETLRLTDEYYIQSRYLDICTEDVVAKVAALRVDDMRNKERIMEVVFGEDIAGVILGFLPDESYTMPAKPQKYRSLNMAVMQIHARYIPKPDEHARPIQQAPGTGIRSQRHWRSRSPRQRYRPRSFLSQILTSPL